MATSKPACSQVAVAAVPGWREHLKVHPAAELFPLMSEDELRELADDIKKNGLKDPVALVVDQETKAYQVLDGRNRVAALTLNGVELFRMGKPRFGEIFQASDRIGDPFAYVISKNIHRRHMTAEQKRDLLDAVIKAKAELSNRQIGKLAKADHHKVADRRGELEATGEVSPVEKRVGADGKARKQPAKKSKKLKAAKAVSPQDTALLDFDARVLDLLRRIKGREPARYAKAVVSADDLASLGKFFADLASLKQGRREGAS